jgi:hypothetical protein
VTGQNSALQVLIRGHYRMGELDSPRLFGFDCHIFGPAWMLPFAISIGGRPQRSEDSFSAS